MAYNTCVSLYVQSHLVHRLGYIGLIAPGLRIQRFKVWAQQIYFRKFPILPCRWTSWRVIPIALKFMKKIFEGRKKAQSRNSNMDIYLTGLRSWFLHWKITLLLHYYYYYYYYLQDLFSSGSATKICSLFAPLALALFSLVT